MTRMLSRPLKIADPYRRDNKWRTYQSSLKKRQTLRRSFRRIPFYAVAAVVLILLTHALFALLDRTLAVPEADYAHVLTEQFETFDKNSLQVIFNRIPFDTSAENRFELTTAGTTYGIRSSLNPGLQEFILGQIDRKNSLYFGFVAMDPASGRILSMVSFDKTGNDANVCIQPEYPAASLFKIITAAAAIEKCGFDCTTPVTFNDNKYTLYKIQLKDRINKYSNRMTFAESFADSVNPVFGKLGKNRLGKSALESYARAFGFNQPFDLEIPLKASVISITDTPYHWAEIASGFNRETQISPLHGAMMIAGIVNSGTLVAPTIIDEIDKSGQVIYRRHARTAADVIAPTTAATLKKMMQETVRTGTASKSFARIKKDTVLSRLDIGGKTGSINNNAKRLKYDWFVGFAEEKTGARKIALSVLVVHQDYIGTRAAQYSKIAIKEYFKNYYATKSDSTEKAAAL